MAKETELERLVTVFTADNKEFVDGMKQAAEEVKKFTRDVNGRLRDALGRFAAEGKSVGSTFRVVGADAALARYEIVGLGDALQELGGWFGHFTEVSKQAVYQAGKFEQTSIAFETMLGSAAEAGKVLADLTKFAAETPFEMPEVEQAARGLITFGERGNELMRTLKIVGNAAAATSTDFGMVALIFNQIRGVGKLLTQDFRQLSTRGILSLTDIAKHFKITQAAAQEMLSSGKISFKDVRDIFESMSKDGGRFAGLMQKQSQSLLGLWSTFKDNMGILSRQLGELVVPALKKTLTTVNELAQGFSKLPLWQRQVIAGTIGTMAALSLLLVTLGPAVRVLGGLAISTINAAKAMTAWMAVTHPMHFHIAMMTKLTLAAKAAVVGLTAGISYLIARPIGDWLWGTAKKVEELNQAMHKADILQKKMLQQQANRNKEDLAEVDRGTAPERKKKLEEAIELQDRQLKGLAEAEVQAMKQLEEARNGWAAFFGDDSVVKENEQKIKHLQENAALGADHAQALKERLDELNRNSVDAGKLKEVADALKLKLDTHGMTADQKQIFELKKDKATDAELKPIEDMQRQLKAKEVQSSVDKMNQSLKDSIATIGMTSQQAAIYKLRAEGATEAQLKWTYALQSMQQQAELRQEVKRTNDELKESIATFGMTSSEVKLYQLRLKGATEEELRVTNALMKRQKNMEVGKRLMDKFESPHSKFLKGQKEINEAFAADTITVEVYQKALRELQEEYHKTAQARDSDGTEATLVGSAEAARQMQAYNEGRRRLTVPGAQSDARPAGPKGLDTKLAQKDLQKEKEAARDPKNNKLLEDIKGAMGKLVGFAEKKDKLPVIELVAAGLNAI